MNLRQTLLRSSAFRFSMLALACLGVLGCDNAAASNNSKAAGHLGIPVKIQEYGKEQGEAVLEFSGTLQENRMVPIAFQVGGRAQSVHVQDGDTIGAGQLIATLDSASLQNAYRLSEAKLIQALDAHKRMQPLHDSGAVPEVKWVEMETGLAQAQAMASLARKDLDDTRLLAPVGGIVVHRDLEVGQSVMPGVPVLSLVDPHYLDAVFTVAETEVLYLRKGQTMRISLPGNGAEGLVGQVTEVGIQADMFSRNYPVRVRLDNKAGMLRLGMACHGVLELPGSAAAQMVLPVQAVLERPDGTRYVYVVQDGKAVARAVRLGGFLGKGLRVLEGLSPGDQVVVEGAHGLTNGLAVKIQG